MNSSKEKPSVETRKIGKEILKKPCRFCNKEISEKGLQRHERNHTGEKPFQCDFCSKRLATASVLVDHKRIHTGERPFKCEQCTKCFRTSSKLIDHKRVHSLEKSFCCSLCGKFFRTSSNLKDHKKCHSAERPYQCQECPKTFARSGYLANHKRTHSNQKPFSCEICNKTFKFSYTLKVHKRTHTGERHYQCHQCPKFFCCPNSLVIHERVHSGEKLFKCDKCDESFPSAFKLKRHHGTHDGIRPKVHKCTECHISFRDPSEVTRHMAIHSRSTPFKCSLCEKHFSCEPDLKKHLNRHKEKEPHECDNNEDPASSRIESEYISEDLSFKDYLIKKESQSEPLSETLACIKREVGSWINEMEDDLSSGQSVEYPECVTTSTGEKSDVALLTVKLEDGYPAEEESSSSFELVSSTSVQQSSNGIGEVVQPCHDLVDMKIKNEDISQPVKGDAYQESIDLGTHEEKGLFECGKNVSPVGSSSTECKYKKESLSEILAFIKQEVGNNDIERERRSGHSKEYHDSLNNNQDYVKTSMDQDPALPSVKIEAKNYGLDEKKYFYI